jgi:hypothetical protein
MADVTVVAASVRPLGGCIIRRFTAGEALTYGAAVYMSANDTVSLADGSAVGTNKCIGIVVSGAAGGSSVASGEECDVVLFGPVTGFSTNMAVNTIFYVSNTSGALCDAAVGADKDCAVGVGINASTILVNPIIIELS